MGGTGKLSQLSVTHPGKSCHSISWLVSNMLLTLTEIQQSTFHQWTSHGTAPPKLFHAATLAHRSCMCVTAGAQQRGGA